MANYKYQTHYIGPITTSNPSTGATPVVAGSATLRKYINQIDIHCTSGNTDSIEAKQAKLEKLKSEQAAITTQIKTLEDEIKSSGAKIETHEKIVNVAVTNIETSNFKHYIDVQGRVDGDENTTISAKVPGLVLNVIAKPGTVVKAALS